MHFNIRKNISFQPRKAHGISAQQSVFIVIISGLARSQSIPFLANVISLRFLNGKPAVGATAQDCFIPSCFSFCNFKGTQRFEIDLEGWLRQK